MKVTYSFVHGGLTYILRRYGLLVAFAVIIIALSIACPAFLTRANLLNIVRQSSIHGVMAIGMTFVILTGGIDLSVGSVLALTGIFCAYLEHKGQPVELIVIGTMGLGALTGLINGVIITKGRVTPLVATLGMMSVARGLAHIFTGGQPVSGFGGRFSYIGEGEPLGVPVPILIFLLAVLVAAVVLRRTRLGRYIYAIGGNDEAARFSGINVDRFKIAAYAIAGLTAALGSVILTARLNAAESIAGQGYELDVIASVVIGGTSLMGGRGSIWGTLLGALLIGTINNGMNLLLIPAYWQLVAKGAIIVCAALIDRLRE